MKETYAQAIKAARERYYEAMEDAAADALMIADTYGKPLQTVCKEIADEDWNKLRHRAQAMAKTSAMQPHERAARREAKTNRNRQASAKSVLKDPEEAAKVIASLPVEALDNLYHEARLARVGEDRTPAARKAAHAASANAVAPMKRAIGTTQAALGIQALREARDDLAEAIAENSLTARQIETADRLVNEIANLLMEAKFGMEVEA